MRRLSRRTFIRRLGGGLAGGLAATTLPGAGCGGGVGPDGSSRLGSIAGTVTRADGSATGVGEIYLMRSDGLQTGRFVQVDADGTWRIPEVPPGDWIVRYWGSGRSHVLHDQSPNPRRVEVPADATARVDFRVELAPGSGEEMVEIYVGDDFFQEQPLGEPNAPAEVPLGYEVCWYSVTEAKHEVRGGPWGSSGVMEFRDSFIWVADETGEFPYQCPYHQPEQKAKLVVVEG